MSFLISSGRQAMFDITGTNLYQRYSIILHIHHFIQTTIFLLLSNIIAVRKTKSKVKDTKLIGIHQRNPL